MTISIWRYSHVTLAISSFIFILIAAITGIILAFEPISNQLKPYAVNTNAVTLAKTVSSLKSEYSEVLTIKLNAHNFVIASVVTKEGKNETFYINPNTGKKINEVVSTHPIYKWTTNLHRSLFLKSTGRFLVGFFSFLLLLITITGCILLIKRQGGIKQFFSKIVNENFNQYYHVIFGRFFFIPIVLITLTGVYLSLDKFSLLPETKIKHNYNFVKNKNDKKLSLEEFPIFKNTKLSNLKSIEFPFSYDEEDYFFLKLKGKELIIHQYSGKILSNQKLSYKQIFLNWSLFIHTGRGTIIWSLVLLFSCICILFFMYSGFAITLKRKQKNNLPKNKIKKDKADIIILIGSESGNTFMMAKSLFKALLKEKKSVYIDHLNNYISYKNANHLIILTATYGDGEPPVNATRFLKLIENIKQPKKIKYSVIGFGSLAYKYFCQFAIDIDNSLKKNINFSPILPIHKINNQSFADFKNWGLQWSKKTGIDFDLKQEIIKSIKQQNFTVINKTSLNIDDSFLIRLRLNKNIKFNSGDLLSIRPKIDNVERLYSIGKIDNDILLSIKKHELGVCSNLLFNLQEKENIRAIIQKNKEFHFSKKSKKTILIANGTGISPFLGMLNKPNETHLFWGGRTKESLKMYLPFLKNLQPTNIHIAFSQESKKEYVQSLILKEEKLIISTLKNNGVIMICGSVAMMNGVLKTLEEITKSHLNTSLNTFQRANQIKTDCY